MSQEKPNWGQEQDSQVSLGAYVDGSGNLSRINHQHLDDAIGRFVFESGQSFRVVELPSFAYLLRTASELGSAAPRFIPSRRKLSSTILDRNVQQLQERIQEALSWTKSDLGLTLVSDGWEDKHRQSFLNHIVANTSASYFVACDNISASDGKTGQSIARRMLNVMRVNNLFDPEDVVLVVTDAASPNLAAHRELKHEMPWLLFSKCIPHQIDLLLEKIGNLGFVKKLVENARELAVSITRGQFPRQKWLEKKPSMDLRRPAETRFATNFLLLRRVFTLRHELCSFVTDLKVRKSS